MPRHIMGTDDGFFRLTARIGNIVASHSPIAVLIFRATLKGNSNEDGEHHKSHNVVTCKIHQSSP